MLNTSDSWPMIGAKEFEHGQERLDPLAIYNLGWVCLGQLKQQ